MIGSGVLTASVGRRHIYVKLSRNCEKLSQFVYLFFELLRKFIEKSLSFLGRVIRFGALKFWNKRFVTKMWLFSKLLFLIKVRLYWTFASPVNKLRFHQKRRTILKITNIKEWNILNYALELQHLWHLMSLKTDIDEKRHIALKSPHNL